MDYPSEADPRLAGSFRNFLTKTWRSLGFPDPTPIHMGIAEWMQYGGDRIVTMAFRGAAKSYIAVPFGIWNLYRDPDLKVLLTSATGRFAAGNATFAFKMINDFEWLAHMKPGPEQKQSTTEFDIAGAVPAKDPSFVAEGIFGQLTGRRADLIIPDDVEVPNTSETEGSRARLRTRISEFSAIIKPEGRIVFLGTAQNEDTVYLDRERAGYAIRIWPIVYPSPDEIVRYGHRLAPPIREAVEADPLIAGSSTEPSRFDESDIAQREMEWGRSEFDRQFRMFFDAGSANDKPLKVRDLMVMDIGEPLPNKKVQLPGIVQWSTLPEHRLEDISVDSLAGDTLLHSPIIPTVEQVGGPVWGDAQGVFMWVDPSGEGTDETTWTIVAQRNGFLFLLYQGASLQGGTEENIATMAADAKRWGVNYIEVESNFGQGLLANLLIPALKKINHMCSVEPQTAGRQQKELRIIGALEPVLTSHRLVVNTQVLRDDFHIKYDDLEDAKRRFYRLTYQLSRVTRTRGCLGHDDRLEGVARACGYFGEAIKRATEENAKAARDEAMDQEVQKLIAAREAQGLPMHGLHQKHGGRWGNLLSNAGRGASKALSHLRRNKKPKR